MIRCPACHAHKVEPFYEQLQVPIHSTLLLESKEEAASFPRGDIILGLCGNCGFVFNTAFDPAHHEYGQRYEETQGFSPTFRQFHRQLAERLIRRHGLHDKTILEIGCGKGEFLSLLCELGPNDGIGFDPAYVPARNHSPALGRMKFIAEFYGERHSDVQADFICCKMTLEHIQEGLDFVKVVRHNVAEGQHPKVFFQVPNARYVFQEGAFWDVYYEHCSYFTAETLGDLFRRGGFIVNRVALEYDRQYLTLEATVPADQMEWTSTASVPKSQELVNTFLQKQQACVDKWKRRLSKWRNKTVVLWGGGSKGVAFLTRLGIEEDVHSVVDINPFKHGKFMAGTGHPIVGPETLKEIKPDVVVVMNPVYRKEITKTLQSYGLNPTLYTT